LLLNNKLVKLGNAALKKCRWQNVADQKPFAKIKIFFG